MRTNRNEPNPRDEGFDDWMRNRGSSSPPGYRKPTSKAGFGFLAWVFILSFCFAQVVSFGGFMKTEVNAYLETHPGMTTFVWVFIAVGFFSSFVYMSTEGDSERSPGQELFFIVSCLSYSLLPLFAILAAFVFK